MQTVILCGGKGTRLRRAGEQIAKALVEVGGRPILWHVMKLYAHYGFKEFVLCLGYQGNAIREYFSGAYGDRILGRERVSADAEQIKIQENDGAEWSIILADTGMETETGGRIKKVEKLIRGTAFMATYADGVADIDLACLAEFHRSQERTGTLVVVHPISQFGVLELDGNHSVRRFQEKPRLNLWINGGFFVFNREFFAYLDDRSVLESNPLEQLAAAGKLTAYEHHGFWACMDTYKDNAYLNDLWQRGGAEWKVWEQTQRLQTIGRGGESSSLERRVS